MSRTHASNPADLPKGTLVDLFFGAMDGPANGAVFRHHSGGRWVDISRAETLDRVRRVAGALRELGLERGHRAAILSENRPEWALADWGCLAAGVVDVPVYSTLPASQIAYILNDAGARLVFVSDEGQLAKIQEIRGDCPQLEHVVVFDPSVSLPEGAMGWDALLELGEGLPEEEFRREAQSAEPDDTATILYTSGTTGAPKGVMLTHDNLHSNVQAASGCIPIDETDSTLSFLPLSHVFQRMVDYLLFSRSCLIAYGRSIDSVADDLKQVKPTIVVSVPRLYEKVYAKVTAATGIRALLVRWASRVGGRWADARLAGRRPGPITALQYRLANALVFRKIRDGVGGRLRYFVSGGGPLSPDINRFFFSAGVVILEGYGLTETSPVTNVNTPVDFPENFRIGTVGKPVPGTEIRIADDGEILVRGPQVMKGYFNQPEATREAIDEDGWFSTGDIGELDDEGFLRITDRKKDIIVTAGGKNVAPQPIENRLKKNRFFDQPVLVGDKERFISLLVVPDFDALEAWAREKGLDDTDHRGLLSRREVQSHLADQMERELSDLSSFETPKKLILLDEPFTIEDGSLTPSQKIKRRVVQERYREVLKTVYDVANVEKTVFTPW